MTIDSPVVADVTGTQVQVNEDLTPKEEARYAIMSANQALTVCRNLQQAWVDGIANATAITAQINGQPPRSAAMLKNMGRGWYPNVNTGFLRTQANRVPGRFSTPVLTAQYLTGAELPAGWPDGAAKSQFFREEFTKLVRNWESWQWFMNQVSREAGIFGFGFAVYMNRWEWRPTFIRQDQGYVPVGATVFEELPFFMVAYDYQVHELIEAVQKADTAGVDGWNKEHVAAAINAASPRTKDSSTYNARSFEELVRQASQGQSFQEAFNTIQTWTLYSRDPDGTVSQHVVLADQAPSSPVGINVQQDDVTEPPLEPQSLLFERRKQFDKMRDAVIPMVFSLDDGTIQGCWGVGQILFDLSIEYEKAFNDWMAANKMVAKIKAQTEGGVNADEVRLKVEDYLIILQGAIYAGNTAAVTTDPKPFQALLTALELAAVKKIGDTVPPIPLTPSDIRAAQVDEQIKQQQQDREQILINWLMQVGRMLAAMSRRACQESSDEQATEFRKRLLEVLTKEEIDLLAQPTPMQTIYDFTEYAIQKKAAFAASKSGNPYYDQRAVERTQAVAAGGRAFADAIMQPGSDPTGERAARRQQQLETTTMLRGVPVDVLPMDADPYHMMELRPELEQVTMAGAFDQASVLLNHYVQHYVGGMAKKSIPGDGNAEKSFIFKVQKAIETGQIPPDGLGDEPNLLTMIEQAMAAGATPSPSPQPANPRAMADNPQALEAIVSAEA